MKKTFHETAIIPYPKNEIKLSLEKRDAENKLYEIYSTFIKPNDIRVPAK
ncbi:MAG: hypothetical protein GY936_20575 [Ignavibacteriae bacterium]|nr:hypothetical protein [Ignavibacteriota bacterium]